MSHQTSKPKLMILGVVALVLIAVGFSFQKKPRTAIPTPQPAAEGKEAGAKAEDAVAIYVPPLAKDLPDGTRSAAEEFTDRLEKQFPTGTAVKTVTSALANQGFTVNETNDATYHAEYNDCKFDWKVTWQVQGGKLEQISGTQESACH